MAKKTGKSSLMEKYGKRLTKAHEAHKEDEVEYGNFAELPPGINAGIAQLVECKLGQYEKGDLEGEYFFYAAGVVVSPKEHTYVPLAAQGGKNPKPVTERIEGGRTSIMEPICDTPDRTRATVEDHVKWIYNELRKLGVDTTEMEIDDLEQTLEGLKEEAPHFKFRTWQGKPTAQYPDPRVNHSWMGTCDYEPGDDEDVDESADDEDEEEEEETPPPKAKKTAAATKAPAKAPPKNGKAPAKKTPPPDDEDAEAFDEFEDLGALAKKAQKGDKAAGKRLTELAVEAGVPAKKVEKVKAWAEVVAMIEKAKPTEDEDAEEETEEESDAQGEEDEADSGDEEAGEPEDGDGWEPLKEDVYRFKPLVNGKPGKKEIECEVESVNEAKKTVTLKALDAPHAQYKNVPWAQLIRDNPEPE